MDFGVCVATHVGDIDYVVRAEELGYASAWLADSQMLWSDCYAGLALAATRTSRIRLGTGVAVTATRPAPVTAAAIGTINALAPGRTFCGVGSGNTAMRVMGGKPQRVREYGRYLATLKPLLRGEEALLPTEQGEMPIRHIMQDKGFVNFTDEIPLYASGFGPRSLAVVGQHADGAVLSTGNSVGAMQGVWRHLEAGALSAGRTLDRDRFYTTALTTIVVLEKDEPIDSARVKAECGAMAMATLHYAYDQWRNFGHEPAPLFADVWDDYCAMLDAVPSERLHQRIHAGHNCWVLPEEERFLTPALLQASSMIGSRDQLLERLSALAGAGLDQVMILPSFDTRYAVLERVARELIGNL